MIRMRLAAVALGVVGVTVSFAGQTAPVETNEVTYYDFAGMPLEPFGPMQARAVVTDRVSFVYAVIPAGMHQTVHYHEQEQISMGLEGIVALSVNGALHPLGVRGAVIPPANVRHGMVNDTDAPGAIVEFQALRRPDWLPPHPTLTFVKSPEPASLYEGQQVSADMSLSSPGWELLGNGARAKSLAGKTIRLATWDLSTPSATAELSSAPSSGDRFLFVMQGRVSVVNGSGSRDLSQDGLALVAAGSRNVQVRSTSTPRTVIAVFESLTH